VDYQPFLLGLASVAVGWSLSELSHFLRATGSKRRALNRALAELIELRHQQLAIDLVFKEIRKRWPVSAEELNAGMQWIDQILPADPQLPVRYEAAVSEIAGVDPLVAFALRSKDRGPLLLAKVRGAQLSPVADKNLVESVDALIRTSFVKSLEQEIRSVAWKLGIISWLRIRWFLRRRPTLPDEAQQLFDLGEKTVNASTNDVA
jgi:hypothetical protein